MMAHRSGFDAAAERYDDDEASNVVLAHMRARSFAQMSIAFAPRAKLIEIGSGTGIEAARLAQARACRVALVDNAPHMLGLAAGRVGAAAPDALLGAHCLRAVEISTLVSVYGRGSFDGAYSSFGPLNCEPSLSPVAAGLGDLVRPGGALVLSVINRFCPSEVLWFALHGQMREATRRFGGPVFAAAFPGGPKDVLTYYYSSVDIERAFSPAFEIEHIEALPLLWPPPYLDFLLTRYPALFRALDRIERPAARMRVLRNLGDHVLLRLRRT